LPVKATTQIWDGGMVALVGGALVPACTAGSGDVIGVADMSILGGATDGAKRCEVMTDQTFVYNASATNPPTDATPYGQPVFALDDNTISLGGLGATSCFAGRFAGVEDDGRVRVFIGIVGSSYGERNDQVFGTNIPNAATATIQRVGRTSRYLLPTLAQNITITIGTTGAVKGDLMRIVRTDASAFTAAVVNGGAGAGTLITLAVSKVGHVEAFFDGTNWLFDGGTV
jgi:hypothetical protein